MDARPPHDSTAPPPGGEPPGHGQDETLRRERDFAHAVLQSVASLVVALDREGRILRFNRAAERTTGWFFSDIWGRPLLETLVHPDDAATFQIALDDLWTGAGTGASGEARWRTRRGDERLIAWTCAALTNGGTQPRHAIVTGNDLTERIRAEAALRQARDELDLRVAERTARLTEINQELEAFTYSVSHDLRAPLRSMQGFAAALIEDYGGALDATARDYADRIASSAGRMEQLIDDLLAYSRLSRTELARDPVSLDAVVTDVLRQLAPVLEERHATVKVNGRLPTVLGHAATLFTVIENLVTNAAKFVAPGTAPHIALDARPTPDGRVRIQVTDNGIGIAPEHVERIFRVFERLQAADRYKGTGIGLAIVKKGLERMHGVVGVTSLPGDGATFWFELDAATEAHR